jgi:thiamine kinase-like enzyme
MHEEITIPELTEVVARLSALLGPREGGVARLEGGITNRNYRVNFGGTDYVVRLPGKRSDVLGIDRESERVATKAAAELGIAPRVASMLDRPACLVTSFIPGRVMTADELRRPDSVETVATDLKAFHNSGTVLPSTFDPLALVERYGQIGAAHGVQLPEGFDSMRKRAAAVRKAMRDGAEHAPVPCHNDLLTANFMLDGDRIQIIDWEYAGMGDRYFDLGNFAVNNGLDDEQEERLLSVYLGKAPDDRRRATLKLYRFVSDLREAMWGVVQTAISELDYDFAGYSAKHFDRLSNAGSDPRFKTWVEAVRR